MRILVTGGAGYIGSKLVAALLERGDHVVVADDLVFGGESLLAFVGLSRFRLIKCDVTTHDLRDDLAGVDGVAHLAAVVGFPACQKAGDAAVRHINVTGTTRVYEAAVQANVPRFVFASSYSSYGESRDGELVTEESPLHPQSEYARSKVDAEQFLVQQAGRGGPAATCLRLATVFGLSGRTRFDLMVNQFALEAVTKGRVEIYQEDFLRSFIHVRDVARAIITVLDAPVDRVAGEVFNVGDESLNTSKQRLVEMIAQYVPGLAIEYRNTSFAGDMRSIHVSFDKIRNRLAFRPQLSLQDGIEELTWALRAGLFADPGHERFRNHPALLL
jgi:nucleoside-diphosphate-sugar epimerase